MNKKLKILLLFIVVIAVGFISMRLYINYGGKRDIQSEETAFTVSSKAIVDEFISNADASNKKYLEKPVAISGTVTSVNGKEVIVDDIVNCNFSTLDSSIKKDQKVVVKGRVIGYDDLMGSVNMDQCSIN
ncbi:MAG: hypothetical protein NT048_00865 [Flavobacterium sp.]|nr:hypothetical protein [Flavobacterium sp.]